MTAMQQRLRNLPGSLKGRSGDPRHADNASDADWQAGYLLGCHSDKEPFDDISQEWLRRGAPNAHPQEFTNWKTGYWSGRYTRL
jgi:hypothetical protein